jgi:hypothetical protein
MTIATPPVAHAGFDFLGKAALVLLTFQLGGLAHMMVVQGLDGPPNGYLYIVMLTALFAATQRKLARAQLARGAVTWFTASRAAVFAVVVLTSVLVVFRGLTTPPARDVTITAAFAAMWAALALKGAAAGRFKPGGYVHPLRRHLQDDRRWRRMEQRERRLDAGRVRRPARPSARSDDRLCHGG